MLMSLFPISRSESLATSRLTPELSQSQRGGAAFWVVIFLGIGAGLFFLPEILGMVGSKKSATERVEISRISEKRAASEVSEDNGERASLDLPKLKNARSNQKALGNADRAIQISWEELGSKRNKAAIIEAASTAGKLAEALPKSASRSKFALLNFKNGVTKVMAGRDRVMPVSEAIRYFAVLRSDVTRALSQDSVSKEVMSLWSQTTMGPVIDLVMNAPRPTFDPQIKLTWLKAKRGSFKGGPNVYQPAKISASGYLVGDQVKSLELVSERGVTLAKVPLTARSVNGYRTFKINTKSDAPVILKATHRDGRIFYKKYRFDGRLDKLHFKGGEYQIPFPMIQAKRGVVPTNFDGRLDRHFAVGSSNVWSTGFFARSNSVWTDNLSGSHQGRLFSRF